MGLEVPGVLVLTLFASGVGTLTGFGTSTIMVPALALFLPLPQTLLFVGVIHWFGDIWKMLFFFSGVRWRLLLFFGGSGVLASYLGARVSVVVSAAMLSRVLGLVLLLYVGWVLLERRWRVPATTAASLAGGALSGFLAGVTGVGGAVRGAFLTAYNLPKTVYLFTSGAIALGVDSTRLVTYVGQGVRLPDILLVALLLGIPVSLLGAYVAKHLVGRIAQRHFRVVVAVFLALVGLKLLVWP